MLTAQLEKVIDLTYKNIISACKDIEKLRHNGYNHLYIMSGFIAHYNIGGFIDYYRTTSLKNDIVNSIKSYNYDNFSPSDKDWDYYKQKKELNERLLVELTKEEYNDIPLKACFCETCGQRTS